MMSSFTSSLLAREKWISACHFQRHSEEEVLREVMRRVQESLSQNHKPLVLLDLDSTLYEVGLRTYQILLEWHASKQCEKFPVVREAMKGLRVQSVGYSLKDTFHALKLDLTDPQIEKACEDAKKFWQHRFFTSDYLTHDRPYPGAAHFTRQLHDLGAEIVYLTGRDEPNMGDGTRRNLLRDEFPWDVERTYLLLKKASHLPDLEHKMEAASFVKDQGDLIASFENEPPNLIALQEYFPKAMHVFVDTVCSDHGAMPGKGLFRIRHFGKEFA